MKELEKEQSSFLFQLKKKFTLSDQPWKVEVWNEFIETLDAKIIATKTSIHDLIGRHYPGFSKNFVFSSQLTPQINKLKEETNLALKKASSANSIEGINADYDIEHKRILTQLKRIEKIVLILESLQTIHSRFEEIERFIKKRKIDFAAKELKKLEQLVDSVIQSTNFETSDQESFINSKVCRTIKINMIRKKAKIRTISEQTIRSLITIKPHGIHIKINDNSKKNITLNKAFHTLELLGALKQKNVSDIITIPLWKYILLPLISKKHLYVSIDTSTSFFELHLNDSGNQNVEKYSSQIFQNIVKVMNFVLENIYSNNKEWINMIDLWGDGGFKAINSINNLPISIDHLEDLVISDINDYESLSQVIVNILIQALPKDIEELSEYLKFVQKALYMEETLIELNLFDSSAKVVVPFIENLENHLARKRRTSVLFFTRKLILNDYFNSDLISATESLQPSIIALNSTSSDSFIHPFAIEDMQITKRAQDIIKIAFRTMDEAVLSTLNRQILSKNGKSYNILGYELYQTCRDIFELFRLLVPVVYEKDLSNENFIRAATLFHNDCLFIAHHLIYFGYIYRLKIDSSLRQKITFIDMVPPFRKIATMYMDKQIKIQVERLKKLCFSSVNLDETIFKKLLHFTNHYMEEFEQLNHHLSNLLPCKVYHHLLFILIDSMMEHLLLFFQKQTIHQPLSSTDMISIYTILKSMKSKLSTLNHLPTSIYQLDQLIYFFQIPTQWSTHQMKINDPIYLTLRPYFESI